MTDPCVIAGQLTGSAGMDTSEVGTTLRGKYVSCFRMKSHVACQLGHL